jgi:hypothetical protein
MPDRVKCLHALVAHELAAPGVSPLGREAALAAGEWWQAGPCVAASGGGPVNRPSGPGQHVSEPEGRGVGWTDEEGRATREAAQ